MEGGCCDFVFWRRTPAKEPYRCERVGSGWLAGQPAVHELANTFTSYAFDGSGNFVGGYPPGPVYPSGYDHGAGGTNVVTPVSSDPFFDVFSELDAGATWAGEWQFVVDGSEYTRGSSTALIGSWCGDNRSVLQRAFRMVDW